MLRLIRKNKHTEKKVWIKPEVLMMNIKKDTFSGSPYGIEGAGKSVPKPPGSSPPKF
ncbi:MAG: hypothetical protein WBK43_07630 [Prolixibacteraceae bacterium]|jgi:hypothetical protein|nr:hypothetical protein [Bacteroidota bacterium]HOS91563.1 hypothetical protein [Prolixibacteraceae bacterium]HPK87172.1 hypothetical protein [Atribacterota bacterium]HQJ86790.1 hypothetical protein [Prolixibacteraceae bacterium]